MLFSLILEGGPVMWVILGAGLLAFGVYVERSFHLHRARIKSDDFLKGIFTVLGRGNIEEALTICDETPGPVAYIVKTAILHRQDEKGVLRSAVDEASLAEVSRMERRLVVVATVAQTAPLLGLLGTVLGMFSGLTAMEQATPLIHAPDVLRGLKLSLITTGAGLTVAIPCYAGFNLLVIKIDRIVLDMERSASETVAFLAGGWGNEEKTGDHGLTDS